MRIEPSNHIRNGAAFAQGNTFQVEGDWVFAFSARELPPTFRVTLYLCRLYVFQSAVPDSLMLWMLRSRELKWRLPNLARLRAHLEYQRNKWDGKV